jgi:putative tricarboxylic transport membrane protein
MLDAFITGLVLVFQWPAIGYLVLGIFIGIWLGAVPGLGGVIGLVILLPFTFGMETVSAFALLLGMYAVTTTSDTIASVMLGIPGTAASQATILDGFPLAQKGEAQRAFGAAFTVSAFGGVFGALILAASLPLILPIILAFGNPEIFALGILGLSMVGTLSGNSICKGLIIALAGLLISSIGYAEAESVPRYFFGADYLLDGLPIIPLVLGLFALPEVMELAIKDTSISRVNREQTKGVTIFTGIRDARTHWWLAVRCATLGTYIGMLPGLGGAIVDWIAYGHAVQSAKDKSMFGQGDIRGVIAPEAANNAIKGGALIPTVAFGIPGNLGTAILLGALLIQGLKPGPDMLTSQLHITFSMVWTIVIANIFAAGLLMVWANQLAKVAFIRGHLIVPGVILFVFMGAWLGQASIGDWVVCLSAGFIGVIMKRGGWPRPPLVLALILGNILENSLYISTMANEDGLTWLTRPIVLIIFALTAITLGFSIRGVLRAKRGDDQPTTGEGRETNFFLSLPLSLILFVAFIAAFYVATGWELPVGQFPLTIAAPAILLCLVVLVGDVRGAMILGTGVGGYRAALSKAVEHAMLGGACSFFGYILAMLLISFVIGQIAALCLFIAVYLWRWGGYGPRVAASYSLVAWAFLFGFYDRVMDVLWLDSMFSEFYGSVMELIGL